MWELWTKCFQENFSRELALQLAKFIYNQLLHNLDTLLVQEIFPTEDLFLEVGRKLVNEICKQKKGYWLNMAL